MILTDDPLTIESILSTCPIPLDKCNGKVRPISVGDVIRRIMANASLELQNMINASGAMQVCAGQKRGREAAIHTMRNIFGAVETD